MDQSSNIFIVRDRICGADSARYRFRLYVNGVCTLETYSRQEVNAAYRAAIANGGKRK